MLGGLLDRLFRRLSLDDVPSPSDDALRRLAEASKSEPNRKKRLFDLLDEAHKFSPPKWMIEAEFRKIWSVVGADRAAGTIEPAGAGKDDRQLKQDYRAIAARRVRLGLMIGVIARRKNITGKNYPRAQRAALVENEAVDWIFQLAL